MSNYLQFFIIFTIIFLSTKEALSQNAIIEAIYSKNDSQLSEMRQALKNDEDKGIEFFNQVFQDLDVKISPNDHWLMTRYRIFQIMVYRIFKKYPTSDFEPMVSQLKENGLRSNDRLLLAHARWYIGFVLHDFQKIDLALGNCMDAIEVFEEFIPKTKLFNQYEFLAEMSFQVVDYESAIKYYKLFLEYNIEESIYTNRRKIVVTNAIGQAYLRKNMFSDAKDYLELANQKIIVQDDPLWAGINNAYLGHVYLSYGDLEKAERLLINAIEVCGFTEPNVSAYASNYLGRLYLEKGKQKEALFYLQQAENILLNSKNKYVLQTQFYLVETYKSLSDFYRTYMNNGLANEYFEKYKSLNDSLQYLFILSSQNINRLRMDNEKAFWELSIAELEKERIIQRRNILLILFISLFLISGSFFLVARNKLKIKHQLAEAEGKRLKAEKIAAETQLDMIKTSLLEKSKMLQEFENRLSALQNQADVQDDLERINEMKILTEEDWTAFRKLFERLYPGFMNHLKQTIPTITTSELRLATLIKMQYSAKEMADILGVSPDSVYKARYRLRTKLNLENEQSLEQMILNL